LRPATPTRISRAMAEKRHHTPLEAVGFGVAQASGGAPASRNPSGDLAQASSLSHRFRIQSPQIKAIGLTVSIGLGLYRLRYQSDLANAFYFFGPADRSRTLVQASIRLGPALLSHEHGPLKCSPLVPAGRTSIQCPNCTFEALIQSGA